MRCAPDERYAGAGEQSGRDSGYGNNDSTSTADKLANAVNRCFRARLYGIIRQMPDDIVRELFDGGITTERIFLQSLQQNVVQVVGKSAGYRTVWGCQARPDTSCEQIARSISTSD